jgi:hypothetical protein
VPGEMAP